jgi:hypothetical protein
LSVALTLRAVPDLPPADLRPPVVAESGDPFSAVRVAHLVARLPRGRAVRLRDIVDRLNVDYLDWSFSRTVVADVIVQLQANWTSDFRTSTGIQLAEGIHGGELTLEDSARIEQWLITQVERYATACRERLRAFARDEGAIP